MFYAQSTSTVMRARRERRAVMQTNTGEWLGRQRSAARRELKTEASWGEFLEGNIGERADRQKLDTRNESKGWSSLD